MVRCYKNCASCGYHEHAEPCCPPKPCCPPMPCEHGIHCCEPACMRPCWDTCKCMDEILKLKENEDKSELNIDQLESRIDKVEKDMVDTDDRLTNQMGCLAQKEQHDIDCIQDNITAERDRAVARENQIENRLATEEQRAQAKETELDGKITADRNERLLRAITDADYNKPGKSIDFKRQDGSIVKSIDVTDFIIDGMVDSVTWNQNTRDLTIIWNTDAGKQPTVIHGDDIFNINNYYTIPQIDAKVRTINDSINAVNDRVSATDSRVSAANSRIDTTNSNIATTNNNLATLNSKVDSMIEDTVDYAEVIDWGRTEAIAKVNNKVITVGIPDFPNVISNVVVDDEGHLIVYTTDDPQHPQIYQLPSGYINRVTTLEEITEQQQTTINNHTSQISNLQSENQSQQTTINNHTTTLNSHTQTLNDHTQTLNNHASTLSSHTTTLGNHDQSINNIVNNLIPSLQNEINALKNRVAALETDNLWYLDGSTGKVTTKNSKAAAAYGFYDTDPNMR